MFAPTLKQTIHGNVGHIKVRIRIEVSAPEADAHADERTDRPTLSAVQNTMVLLVRPVFTTLGIMETLGLDALVAGGPATPPADPGYQRAGKLISGDYDKTRKDAEEGKGD